MRRNGRRIGLVEPPETAQQGKGGQRQQQRQAQPAGRCQRHFRGKAGFRDLDPAAQADRHHQVKRDGLGRGFGDRKVRAHERRQRSQQEEQDHRLQQEFGSHVGPSPAACPSDRTQHKLPRA
jgi:hypothetical protein